MENIKGELGKNYQVHMNNDVFCGALRAVIKREDGHDLFLFLEEKWRLCIDHQIDSIKKQRGQ